MTDLLFPSDNLLDIPTLRADREAGPVALPLAGYASGRHSAGASTIHFYVDDYRFESLWRAPSKIFGSSLHAVVEPNFSLFDTTPLAFGLYQIYRKRWLARYWQEQGIRVYADLHVSSKFYEHNRMGIPSGYNAFATRGVQGHLSELECEVEIAREISGLRKPNMFVYGGGREIQEFCIREGLLYIHDFMSTRRKEMMNG